MRKNSLQQNALLSGIQKLFSIIFPLITFPYVSRILPITTIGKVNFANSIIAYFVLIAGLGVNNYAIREGAKVRHDKHKLEKLCSEIFTINVISTVIAYILLGGLYLIWPQMRGYSIFLLIASFNIIGGTIGIAWLYSIFEDYMYITIRTIAFQILSLVLMFTFVRTATDGSKYMCISVIAAIGANILNLIHSRKYIKLRLTRNVNWKQHMKPIMVIFASSIAITIYVNSDVTILGWIKGDYEVGIYSIAVKFYNIFKQIVVAMIIVALPRISTYLGNGRIEEYKKTAASLFIFLLSFTIPIVIGLICVADLIVPLVTGNEYMQSIKPLQILAGSLLFAVLATFATYVLILPNRLEKKQLQATIGSSIVNIVLNFILIPKWGVCVPAFTTLVSELLVFSIETYSFKINDNQEIFKVIFSMKWKNTTPIIIGVIFIILTTSIIRNIEVNILSKLGLDIAISFIGYISILLAFKSEGLEFLRSAIGRNIEDKETL